jgi:hypothetical protein
MNPDEVAFKYSIECKYMMRLIHLVQDKCPVDFDYNTVMNVNAC